MDLHLADKVAVVTGANKGIGLAVTKALVDEGAYVVAGSRNIDKLDGLDRVTAVPVDLTSSDGPASLVARAIDEHGRLDVLVNSVGAVRIRLDGFLGTSDQEFEWRPSQNDLRRLEPHHQQRLPRRCSLDSDGIGGRESGPHRPGEASE